MEVPYNLEQLQGRVAAPSAPLPPMSGDEIREPRKVANPPQLGLDGREISHSEQSY